MMMNDEKMLKEYESIQSKINPSLYKNPRFKEEFIRACTKVVEELAVTDYLIEIDEDENGVTISSVAHCVNVRQEMKNNKAKVSTRIYLNHDSLFVDEAVGKLFRGYDIKLIKSPIKEGYQAQLYVDFDHREYDKYGIKMSSSYYTDHYDYFDEPNDISINKELEAHRPIFNNNMLPLDARHHQRPSSGVQYRFGNSLGIVHMEYKKYVDDDKFDIFGGLYENNYKFPERLEACGKPVAEQNMIDGSYSYNIGFFGDDKPENPIKFVQEKFEQEIEDSETKKNNPELFAVIKMLMNKESA